MLSDTTIVRDGIPPLFSRVWGRLKVIISKKRRAKIRANIQESLKDIDFSIFCNNCLGGIIYHDAGKRFTTPTINVGFDGNDFLNFLEKPKYYLDKKMVFVPSPLPNHNYPIAHIEDVELRFVHSKTPEEAERKWTERKERIIWDNLFIIATNQDGLNTPELMERFDKLPTDKKIMFVSKKYPQYDWAIYMPKYKNRFQIRDAMSIGDFKGRRNFEQVFNLYDWIVEKSSQNAE